MSLCAQGDVSRGRQGIDAQRLHRPSHRAARQLQASRRPGLHRADPSKANVSVRLISENKVILGGDEELIRVCEFQIIVTILRSSGSRETQPYTFHSLPMRRLSASIKPAPPESTPPEPAPPEPTPIELKLPEFTLFELPPTPPAKASHTPSFEITDLAALPSWAAFDGAFMDFPLLPCRHLCPLEFLEPDVQKDPKRMELPEQQNPCRSVDMPNGMLCKGWSFSRPSSGIGKYRWACTFEAHIPKSAFRGQKSLRFSVQARLEFGSLDCPLSADEVIVLVAESNKSSFIEITAP